jgi:hypothetical protein
MPSRGPVPSSPGRLSPELLVNRRPEPSPPICDELLGHFFPPRGEFLRKGHRLREYHVAFVLFPIFPIYPVILSSPSQRAFHSWSFRKLPFERIESLCCTTLRFRVLLHRGVAVNELEIVT